MEYSIYELLCFFIIYAFLGWCSEVAFAALRTGKFVNRGFLNGPVCPIYGFGVVIVVICLTPLKENVLLLFIGAALLTSALEFVTGFVLEKVFHDKWWDYSERPFNIMGYVCLEFSIMWGLACILIMDAFHPIVTKFVRMIPFRLGVVLAVICLSAFLVDCLVTVTTIMKLQKHLRLLNEISGRLKVISDAIGENISDGVTEKVVPALENAKEKGEEYKQERAERSREHEERLETYRTDWENKKALYRQELDELKGRYRHLTSQKVWGRERLLNAFPNLKNGKAGQLSDSIHDYMMKIKAFFDKKGSV
ncbi:putative ABC transporter permease [Anaerolentibacter hominis]|uniref:putative ABC transporter permease n=1 Tax=Anaerolentibacter hominis TaxID=3079009 RepID=UPI0031B8ABD9